MDLSQLQEALQGRFDSVEETRDETYIARAKPTTFHTMADGSEEMKTRLRQAMPNAAVVSAGNIRSGSVILQWWVEFTVQQDPNQKEQSDEEQNEGREG